MSTTDSSPYREAFSRSGRQVRIPTEETPNVPPGDVFTETVQRSPRYCNNCFNYRRYVSAHDFFLGGELGWLRYERYFCVPGANSPDPNREQRKGKQKLCCAECGHHTGQDRGLTPNQVTAHAGRLSRALRREGVNHDRETLLCEARRRAYDPETSQAEDDRVFRPAVAAAVRAAD